MNVNPKYNLAQCEERIKRARVFIMRHKTFCAFSGVLSCGPITLDESLNPPTAATNGWGHKFHPAFVASLNDKQLRFLMLHEAMHAAYRHLRVWKNLWEEDAHRTNVAADLFVNTALFDMDNGEGFIEMPPGDLKPDAKWRGKSVGQIWHMLPTQPPKQQGGGGNGEGEDSDEGEGSGHGGFDSHDFEDADVDAQTEQARATQINRALRQGEMLARRRRGTGKGGSHAVIEDLLTPKVPWQDELREFVREVCQGRDESTWARPNRRYIGSDTYMPSMYSEKMGDLVVGFDTSGSCFSSDVLTRFVSELKAAIDAVQPDRVRVVCWDWGVQSDQTFDGDSFDVPKLQIRGGGGTNGAVLFDLLKSEPNYRPQAVINFTDGEFLWPEAYDVPTLWVVTERGITAPWGRTITMEV